MHVLLGFTQNFCVPPDSFTCCITDPSDQGKKGNFIQNPRGMRMRHEVCKISAES